MYVCVSLCGREGVLEWQVKRNVLASKAELDIKPEVQSQYYDILSHYLLYVQ